MDPEVFVGWLVGFLQLYGWDYFKGKIELKKKSPFFSSAILFTPHLRGKKKIPPLQESSLVPLSEHSSILKTKSPKEGTTKLI